MRFHALLISVFLFLANVVQGAQLSINFGTNANDGTGDTLRTAFGKVNTNFTDIYTTVSNIVVGATPTNLVTNINGFSTNLTIKGGTITGVTNLVYPTGPATAYGDSITASSTIYTPALAALTAWTVTNLAVAGTQIADLGQIGAIFTNTVTTNSQSWILSGYNDMRFTGSSALGQAMYSNTLAAAAVWLTVPRANIVNGQSSAITYTGSWSNDPVYPIVAGKYTSANGATASTTLYGKTIYVCSMGNSSAGGASGSFVITIDGTAQTSVNPYSVYLTTGNSQSYAPYLARYSGLSDGPHTVVMTVTSTGNDIHLFWMAGSSGASTADGPNFYVGNCLAMTSAGYAAGTPYNNGSDAIVRAYNRIISGICGNLLSDGLNVYYVPMNSYLASRDVSGDSVHPTSTGGAYIAADFAEAMKFKNRTRTLAMVQQGSTSSGGGSASAGGSSTSVQYNSAGAFGGDTYFTYSGLTLTAQNISAPNRFWADQGVVTNVFSVGSLAVGTATPSTMATIIQKTAATRALDTHFTNNTAYAAGSQATWWTEDLINDSASANVGSGSRYVAGGQFLGGLAFSRNGSASDQGIFHLITGNGTTPTEALTVDQAQISTFANTLNAPLIQAGSVTVTNTLTAGSVTVTTNLTISGSGAGTNRFYDGAQVNYADITAPSSISANYALVLPTSAPTAGSGTLVGSVTSGTTVQLSWAPAYLGITTVPYAWYDARSNAFNNYPGTTPCANNDVVKQWSDLSGNGRHLTNNSANQWVYKLNQQNGLPGLTGTSVQMQTAQSFGGLTSMSVFMVMQPVSWTGYAMYVGGTTQSPATDWQVLTGSGSGDMYFGWGSGTDRATSASLVAGGTTYTLQGRVVSLLAGLRKNNGNWIDAAANSTGSSPATALRVGRADQASSFKVFALVIYSPALSASDSVIVEKTLNDTWASR